MTFGDEMTRAAGQPIESNIKRLTSRTIGIREEMRLTIASCNAAAQQLKDDHIINEVERAMEDIALTIKGCQNIWLCGNGSGFSLATDVAYQLATPASRFERPTRATVLGMNGSMTTTSYGKCGSDDALSAELRIQGRRGDVLWCFARDATSQALLGVATIARQELDIPVITFTEYPGTPLAKFATSKIRIQAVGEKDHSGYCIQWAHSFLAGIMCNQLKRVARRTRI